MLRLDFRDANPVPLFLQGRAECSTSFCVLATKFLQLQSDARITNKDWSMANGSNGGSRYVEKFYGVPGHIYVARNDAHRDGIYKIGLTTRVDPATRIKELNKQAHEARVTGHIGHLNLVCSYETIDCGRSESTVHEKLAQYRYSHNREFFELRLEAIQDAIKSVIAEIERTVRVAGETPQQRQHAEKKLREAMLQSRMAEEQRRREKAQAQQDAEGEIRRRYHQRLEAEFPTQPFWQYWLGCSFIVAIAIEAMGGKESLPASAFFGLIAGGVLQAWHQGRIEKSAAYKAVEAQRDREIENVRSG